MTESENCPLEDYLYNWSQTMPILAIIHGRMQIGKSTLFNLVANNMSIMKYNTEWDYKKYCARSLNELIEMVKEYDGCILGYEEAQKELNVTKWYDEFAQLFSLLMETQGYKKNIIILVMPCGMSIPNRHRRMINIGIEVLKKNEKLKRVFFRVTTYDYSFWKLDENYIWYGHLGFTGHTYTDKELLRAKDYTNWLIEAKQIIMNRILERSQKVNNKYEFENKNPNDIQEYEKIVPVKIKEY